MKLETEVSELVVSEKVIWQGARPPIIVQPKNYKLQWLIVHSRSSLL